MSLVEPVPDEAAARLDLGDGRRALLVADYHAGIEGAIRHELGLEVRSRGPARRDRLLELVDRLAADLVVVLGDLTHSIGEPKGGERGEVEVLLEALGRPVLVVRGNHDGALESWLATLDGPAADVAALGSERLEVGDLLGRPPGSVAVADAGGVVLGDVGLAHGHAWPSASVLDADAVCVAHEHPTVELVDEVGGRRVEPVWLRGRLDRTAFAAGPDPPEETPAGDGGAPAELVVTPAFNRLVGGTRVNVAGADFLSPFLPDALADGEAYLLDGTRLGPYEAI